MAEYSLDDLYNTFMEHGKPALEAYVNDNLEQFLIGTGVESDIDLTDLEMDDEWGSSMMLWTYFGVLKKLGFSDHQLKKLGVGLGFDEDPRTAAYYAKDVIDGRWPEVEDVIRQDSTYSVYYASNIIKGRWSEAEDVIKQDPDAAFEYARDVVKDRWPEAEDVIKKDPELAYRYAKKAIGGRWPEAEEYIKQDSEVTSSYERFIGHELS